MDTRGDKVNPWEWVLDRHQGSGEVHVTTARQAPAWFGSDSPIRSIAGSQPETSNTGSPRTSNRGVTPRPGRSEALIRPISRRGAPDAVETVT